ncbi:hypothetical protein MC885_019904, partial [Smutsia gigantea]
MLLLLRLRGNGAEEDNGTSALHAAVLNRNIKTVLLLLEAGADPSLRNKANELPAELTQNERILSPMELSYYVSENACQKLEFHGTERSPGKYGR